MNKLSRRQLNEKNFHDRWAKSIFEKDLFYKESFESPTAIENQFILSKIGSLKGKFILDLGCGIGDASIYFAKKGAFVKAVDISPQMIALVKKFSSRVNVANKIDALVMAAENLSFKSSEFDVVYGNGVLHHVNLIKSSREIKRVLKKGGLGFFIEPLSYNPVIEFYRKIAKRVRTKDEKPLTLKDIKWFCNLFPVSSHYEFHFLTLVIFIWFFIGKRISPNQERYWKKILKEGNKYQKVFNLLNKLDYVLLKYLPFLRRFCWITVIAVQK